MAARARSVHIKVCGRESEDWLIQLANCEGVAEEAIQVLLVKGGYAQKEPGMIIHVVNDQKWPLKKRQVIAHIKARSKHSFLTIYHNKKIIH